MKDKILMSILMMATLCGCSSHSSSSSIPPVDENILVSKIVTNKTKNYLEVDGKPFVYNGIQIRTDWLEFVQNESIDDLDYYFQVAEDLGVNCVEIPLRWKDLEPKEDAYDFRRVSKYMNMAKAHHLKIEFLLFGVNIGGMTGTVPDYVKNDKERFSQYENTLNHPDALFFVQDNPNLLSREKAAAEALMSAIYNWSKQNQENIVIAIQVRNEPDLYEDRRVENSLRKSDGELLSAEEAYAESFVAIKEIGETIKASKYQVINRVNVCCYARHTELNFKWWNDLLSLDCIDVVGEDTYRNDVKFNKDIILRMKNTVAKEYDSIPQIAENTGSYNSTNSLFLMTNMLGGGYNMYDMITPSVITDNWGYTDWGLLDNKTKRPKENFVPAQKTLKGINKAGYLFPTVDSNDIALFNINNGDPEINREQTINTSKSTYSFSTTAGAVGFAINNNDYIYTYFDNDASLDISNTTYESSMDYGYFNNNGEFIIEGSQAISNSSISFEGEKLYRIKTNETQNLISDTIENILKEDQE